MTPATAPPELAALEERARVVAHLGRIHALLFWDQNTMMPPGGAVGRADHSATLESVTHERLTDPEIGRLLDVLEPWAAGEDPDADAVRLVAVMRRDFEKAVRVPTSLAAEMSRADSLGEAAWQEARARAPTSAASATRSPVTSSCAPATSRASPASQHPYDVVLDDFEPGMTTAQVRPLLAELAAGLVPLVAGRDGAGAPDGRPLAGPTRSRISGGP